MKRVPVIWLGGLSIALAAVAQLPGCGNDFLGLEDYQRDLLGGLLAGALLGQGGATDPPPGETVPGNDGLACWDLNGNGVGEPEEDANGDGNFDVLDCEGPAGRPGPDGSGGGDAGTDGISCWDRNGNGLAESSEDVNGDGAFNVFDCRGAAGPAGESGGSGSTGPDGADGPRFFKTFIDDFFAADGFADGNLPVNLVRISEPVLGGVIDNTAGRVVDAVAYRTAIPDRYGPGNDVTMRVIFHRTGPFFDGCFVFTLDARRSRVGEGVGVYGARRWVRIDLPNGNNGGQPAGGANIIDDLLVIDLPINTTAGLGFPNDLAGGGLLAFELATYKEDGGSYHLLGVEFFESQQGSATRSGATVFDLENTVSCGCVGIGSDCNTNGQPDDCEIELGISSDCNSNGVPDECDIALGQETGTGGPVIIGGDDADDHGDVDSGANERGWIYLEDGFNLLGPQVLNGNTKAVCLGCNVDDLNQEIRQAFESGFGLSNLPGMGWTQATLTGPAAIGNFFAGVGEHTIGNTGIIYMPAHEEDTRNEGTPEEIRLEFRITDAEMVVINANAAAINQFIADGGGLFAHDQSQTQGGFGWLETFLPDLVVRDDSDGGCNEDVLTLTSEGLAAFPSLTNTIVSNATPWHSWFSGDLGGLEVLVTGTCNTTNGQEPVIIGGSQVRIGGSQDCNTNGIPDECEIRDCGLDDPTCSDCDTNGIPDECDLASGTSDDCNTNGVPDDCEKVDPCPSGIAFTFDEDLEGWRTGAAGGSFDAAGWRSSPGLPPGCAKLDGSDFGTPDGLRNSWIVVTIALPTNVTTMGFDTSAHNRDGADSELRVRLEDSGGVSHTLLDWEVISGAEGVFLWTARSADISAFAGQTVTIYFEQGDNDVGIHEQRYIDNIVIE